ncbi:MAG: RrF2 family transcriptional regulator [Caldimicrobium sp.]
MEFGIFEDYAVRIILYLSRKPEAIVSRSEISKAMHIPITVIAKIGQYLERAGLVEIYRGKRGGYKLKKNPREITLLEVLESIVGKITLNKCVDNPNFCVREGICPVHFIWKDINEKFRSMLQIDFERLVKMEAKLKSSKEVVGIKV